MSINNSLRFLQIFQKLQTYSLKSELWNKKKLKHVLKSWLTIMSLVLQLNLTLSFKFTINTLFQDVLINKIKVTPIQKDLKSISALSKLLLTKSLKLKNNWMPGKLKVLTTFNSLKKSETICGKLESEWTEFQDSCQEIKDGQNGMNSFFFEELFVCLSYLIL